jgi:hypothetical protein
MKTQPQHSLAHYGITFLTLILVLTALLIVTGSHPSPGEAHVITYHVNSLGDDHDFDECDGYCSITAGGTGACTLRAALEENSALVKGWCGPPDSDPHTISIDLPGTITLANLELLAEGNLTIVGQGSTSTVIDGASSSGVFHVEGTVTMRDLHIKNGYAASGGGITNGVGGNLTLEDVNITDNTAYATYGGGIRNNDQLTLTRVFVAGNSALQTGGGIYNASGSTLTIEDSTFYRNTVPDSGDAVQGGAIDNYDGAALTIRRTTFEGNRAPAGGGLFNDGLAMLTNVTFFNNQGTTTGGASGGAIFNVDWNPGVLRMWNVTIAMNESAIGGALMNSGTIDNLAHTIIAENTGGDCSNIGTVNAGNEHFNLDGDGSCATYGIFTDPSDMTSTDPDLLPLADNGGLTETMALAPGSPAIDAGGTCTSGGSPLLTDQRGWSRTIDGDGDGAATCDLGAYEATIDLFLPAIMR